MTATWTVWAIALAAMLAIGKPADAAPVHPPAQAVPAEMRERTAIRAAARADFQAGRYDALDALTDQYRAEGALTQSGVPKLEFVYDGLRDIDELYVPDYEPAFDKFEGQIRDWLAANPHSVTAQVLRARAFIEHAWRKRGPGFANTVTMAQWAAFRDLIGKASDQLERTRDVGPTDPQWFVALFDVARAQGWPRDVVDHFADEALARRPDDIAVQNALIESRLPMWGGSWSNVEAAIDLILAHTRATSGEAAYARAYWYVIDRGYRHGFQSATLVRWPRMKRGFDDLVARWPTTWNYNLYGASACKFGDVEALKTAMAKIGREVFPGIWKSAGSIDQCKNRIEQQRIDEEDLAHARIPQRAPAERLEQNEVVQALTDDLKAERFEALDAARDRFIADHETTSSGRPKISLFYDIFADTELLYGAGRVVDRPNFVRLDALIAKWRAARPQSKAAALGEASTWLMRARMAMYSVRAHADSDRAREGAEALARLRAVLKEIQPLAGDDPKWWALSLGEASQSDAPNEVFDALAWKSLQRFPDNYDVRVAVLARQRPGRLTLDFNASVTLIAAANGDQAADAIAQSYLWATDSSGARMPDGAPWPEIRRGLQNLIAARPTDWNLNRAASLACAVKDRATASVWMERIGDRVVERAWPNWRAPKTCSEWIAGRADAAAL